MGGRQEYGIGAPREALIRLRPPLSPPFSARFLILLKIIKMHPTAPQGHPVEAVLRHVDLGRKGARISARSAFAMNVHLSLAALTGEGVGLHNHMNLFFYNRL